MMRAATRRRNLAVVIKEGRQMSSVLPDPTTDFGQRVAQRLREETVIWITSVGADGMPYPNPVWYVWDGESFLIYTQPGAARLKHIQRNPRVALNFDTRDDGDDVVIFTGAARLAPEEPPIHENSVYMTKYRDDITRVVGTPEQMAATYSVALRVTPKKVRGF
jgi:PPOX class probable F420-dependent enzyme